LMAAALIDGKTKRISNGSSRRLSKDRQYETCAVLAWLVRGDGDCRSFAGAKFAKHNKDGDFRRRLFLVHSTGVRQSAGSDEDEGRLLRRDRAKSDLRISWLGENQVSRVDRDCL